MREGRHLLHRPGGFPHEVAQPAIGDLLQVINGEVQRVRLAVVGFVGHIERKDRGVTADGPQGLRHNELIL